MMKLIKLELKKNNLKPYLLGNLGIFILIIALGTVLCAIPVLAPEDPSAEMFNDPSTVVTMCSIISMTAFSILASIMHSKFVVEEYTGKKNILLFTYPQKRSSILLAKFVLIFTYVFVSVLAVNTIGILLVGVLGKAVGFVSGTAFSIGLILKFSLIFSLLANFIGLISLRIGFFRKSIIVPIVVSTILTSPFSNMVMLFKDNSFFAFVIAGLVLLIISTILFLGLLKKVNKMECVS